MFDHGSIGLKYVGRSLRKIPLALNNQNFRVDKQRIDLSYQETQTFT